MIDLSKPKRVNDFLRLTLTLFIIAALTAALVGAVDSLTRDTIAENQQKAYKDAQSQIFQDADFIKQAYTEKDVHEICVARALNEDGTAGDEIVGYTVKVTAPGRNGDIELLVGVKPDKTVARVIVLSSMENANGAKTGDESFLEQYVNKTKGITVAKSGGNTVAAVTSGTISSNAVTKGVNTALYALDRMLDVKTGDGSDGPAVSEPTDTPDPGSADSNGGTASDAPAVLATPDIDPEEVLQ